MTIKYKVHCSKGTYIRTLCEDIAKELGTVGFMKELHRIRVGEFSIDDSLKIAELQDKEKVEKNFITIEKFFENKDQIELDDKELTRFLNGVKIKTSKIDEIYKIYFQGQFIGVGIVENGDLKRNIVISD